MSTSKICHFLIGIPGSGKSTFAHALAKLGNYVIVSTDEIRAALYGDAKIQGNWNEVENQVILLIGNAIASGKAVIYDATNCKRAFRLDFLMKVEPRNLIWIAWYLKTPIEICLKWNQQRDRQVPPEIIASMYKSLLNFPPVAAEGFAAVEEIDLTALQPGTEVLEQIERIQNLHRRIINRHNCTQHRKRSGCLVAPLDECQGIKGIDIHPVFISGWKDGSCSFNCRTVLLSIFQRTH